MPKTVLTTGTILPADGEVIPRTGLHWHPHLEIYRQGQKVPIPANTGISPAYEEPIHTHEDDGTIHLEFPGLVTKTTSASAAFSKSGVNLFPPPPRPR